MRRLLVIGVVLAIAQQTTGINVVMYYAPTVLETSGLTRSASLLCFRHRRNRDDRLHFVGMWILGLMGRRKMMLIGFSGVAASHLGLLVTYLLPESNFRSYLILLFMLLVTAFMVTFLGTTGFLVLSELFPLPIRGFAMGASLGGLWIANSLISFLFPILADQFGSVAIFSGFLVLNVLAAVFALRYVPETEGAHPRGARDRAPQPLRRPGAKNSADPARVRRLVAFGVDYATAGGGDRQALDRPSPQNESETKR